MLHAQHISFVLLNSSMTNLMSQSNLILMHSHLRSCMSSHLRVPCSRFLLSLKPLARIVPFKALLQQYDYLLIRHVCRSHTNLSLHPCASGSTYMHPEYLWLSPMPLRLCFRYLVPMSSPNVFNYVDVLPCKTQR